ncbi:hypothetical protein TNCV_4138131 [Trichonephila clavipes]|nr:hypothetical protein TNCV_4138131 [Trichonephila clavipes]
MLNVGNGNESQQFGSHCKQRVEVKRREQVRASRRDGLVTINNQNLDHDPIQVNSRTRAERIMFQIRIKSCYDLWNES